VVPVSRRNHSGVPDCFWYMPNGVPVRYSGETEMIPAWKPACHFSCRFHFFGSGVETDTAGIFWQTNWLLVFLPQTIIF
jgi:hypothetical protein